MQSINHKSIFSKKLLTLFFSAFLIAGFFLVKVENTLAGSYLGPTGWSFLDQQDTTGGGGVLNDVTFTTNASVTVCTAFNGSVHGAFAVTNGNTYGIIDYGGSGGGSVTGNHISDGDWLVFQQTPGVGCVIPGPTTYGTFTLSGGGLLIPPDTTTRIDTFTYSTSTRIANVTGYWNTHASSTERLSFWQSSNMLGQESYESFIATTTGAFDFSFEFLGLPTPYSGGTTTAPFIAPYTLHAEINQLFPDFNPFSGEGTPPALLAATSTVVSTLTYGLPDYTTGVGLQEYPEYECGISSITGCLKNAGIWLFYPSTDSVERFKSLSDSLAGKFPFAYVYGMNTMRQELFESAQTATTTISLNFKIIPGHATSSLTLLSSSLLSNVPYANTVKTIIGFILWLMAAEYVYYRVLRSHDPNTPQ